MKRVGDLLPFVIGNDDCVAGIVTARTAGANVCVRRQDIDEFAFALVTPLGTEAGTLDKNTQGIHGKTNTTETPSGADGQHSYPFT